MISIGTVISNKDAYDGGRLQVKIFPADKYKKNDDVEYAFPAIPKHLHVMPKIGEAVLIFTEENQSGQRYWMGPVISQPQQLDWDSAIGGATRLLYGSSLRPQEAISRDANADGAFAVNDANESEVAVYGRGKSDIILGENDIRVRCGARKKNPSTGKVEFNKKDSGYLKIAYNENGYNGDEEGKSVAVVNADKVILSSNNGTPYINTNNPDKSVSEEDMVKLIEKAHKLPYGDLLVDFLKDFVNMFLNHSHAYHDLSTSMDDKVVDFLRKYPLGGLDKKLLSQDIKIR